MGNTRRQIYAGRVIDVGVESVTLPNGRRVELEIVRHPGGSAVVALNAAAEVCLLRQYRHAGGGWLWELPAGKRDHGEPPLETARRELAEEAGRVAARWVPLGELHSSPAIFTEVIHLFLARELTVTELQHEPDEVLEVHWLPFDHAYGLACSGDITDAKTVAGLCRAASVLDPSPEAG